MIITVFVPYYSCSGYDTGVYKTGLIFFVKYQQAKGVSLNTVVHNSVHIIEQDVIIYHFAGFCARVDSIFALSEKRDQRTILSDSGHGQGAKEHAGVGRPVRIQVNI